MSTFPGLTAVIAGVIGKHYPGDPALPAAIARAVAEFATTGDGYERAEREWKRGLSVDDPDMGRVVRAALGVENADG